MTIASRNGAEAGRLVRDAVKQSQQVLPITNPRVMDLTKFTYHPDPIASGSVQASEAACRCCRKKRGFIYVGPVYSEHDGLDDALCPWCIADGKAHEKFDASFTDEAGFPDEIPRGVIEEVAYRTPGFNSWQEGQWLTCCSDATAFLEPVGYPEIKSRYPQSEGGLVTYIVQEMGISGAAAIRLLQSLSRNASPTAYVFKCRHCDNQPAYVDCL